MYAQNVFDVSIINTIEDIIAQNQRRVLVPISIIAVSQLLAVVNKKCDASFRARVTIRCIENVYSY